MPVINEEKFLALREAADITEIQQLIGQMVSYQDKMDIKSIWEKLFANKNPEVRLELGESGAYVGPEHVGAYFKHWDAFFQVPEGKRGWMDFQHLATPLIVVSKDGLKARGLWSFFCPQAKEAMPYGADERILTAMWVCGKLNCEFVREDGKWKILKYHQVFYLRTPYDLGWLKQADCMRVDPFFEIMPDEPVTYYTYHPDAVYGGENTMYNWGPFLPECI